MNKSDQINELATALSKAQAEISGALKDSKNPFFKSNYADLQSVWDACRIPLTKNNLCVMQLSDTIENSVVVETVLAHSSGQWISSQLKMLPEKNTPQAIGSCISYARRYSLASMVGVYQTDDDAEGTKKQGEQNDTKSEAIRGDDSKVRVEPVANLSTNKTRSEISNGSGTKRLEIFGGTNYEELAENHPFATLTFNTGIYTNLTFKEAFKKEQNSGHNWSRNRLVEKEKKYKLPDQIVKYLDYASDCGAHF
jgi:hypothetical protein